MLKYLLHTYLAGLSEDQKPRYKDFLQQSVAAAKELKFEVEDFIKKQPSLEIYLKALFSDKN